MKFSNIDKSTTDFKTKILKTLTHFNLVGDVTNFLFEDPIVINIILVLSELICSVLAAFGNKFGAWMIGLHFSFTTFLFFNPFLPENSFSLWSFDIRHDMLSSYGVVCCFFLIAYYEEENSQDKHIIEGIDSELEEFVDTLDKIN